MADALVSFMLDKLATLIQDEFNQELSLVVGAEKEVQNLKTTFKHIQAVLNDAEQRQIKDEAVKLWLVEFKDIAYDMDDVLDEWSFEMHKSQIDDAEISNKKVTSSSYLCCLCSCFSKVALRHNIGTQIKDIKQRLDQVEIAKNRFCLVKMKSNDNPIKRLKATSLVNVTDILGRDTDKETILNKLMFLGESSTNQPESSTTHAPNIISIVGMGGLGKTTLAQLVFNDDQVKTHFEKTMWVCVSHPFDLVTVAKAIIQEANCEVPKSSEWNNTLHHSLFESIKGKRFLLVLDDVRTEDRSIWERLEVCFRSGEKGSRILVTTRNEGVANMMSATYKHPLGVLSVNDCSSLLTRIALAGRNKENHEDLRKIGDQISEKCKGLPLAAKTLGGLLKFKKTKKEWLSILESEIWKLEKVESGFLKPALLLSYYDLPLPLKGCFVYCSIFPKDHVIEKDFLVKLWMAQGFLKSKNGNEELEMIGDDYFNNLAMRSFFQNFSEDNDGNIISCKMHDLVHDLAQYLTKNECFVTQNNGTQLMNSSTRVRHLTLVSEEEVGQSTNSCDHITSSVCNARKLRTLQILKNHNIPIKEVHADLFHQLRYLKVLCLNGMGLESLSSEIENLIHLRYLDLSRNSELKMLPETISNLYNLQTLNLQGCHSLCELPREMWRLINLRHLDIRQTYRLSHIPQGIGRLTSLRTLSYFIVGGASEGCKIGELKNLNLLQGDLNIRGLGRVETVNEAVDMKMKQKQLHTLMLGFEGFDSMENLLSKRMEDVLEVLEPHPDVVEVSVHHYLGFKLSCWIGSTSILSHLKTLNLISCINLTKFPAFGQLPSLEVLYIRRAIKVKHIGFEFYSDSLEHVKRPTFPKLRELSMNYMDNLEVWDLEHGEVMPKVESISLENCPKLKALPALGKLPSLEKLIIIGADELRHVGREFLYEVDEAGGERFKNIAFPKLETLSLTSKELEFGIVGSTGVGEENIIIMPRLRDLEIGGGLKNWKPFVEFLSKISSLESLGISGEATDFIKYIRRDDDDDRETIFPNLNTLRLVDMEDMEELKIGFQVMPLLNSLQICRCKKLKAIQGSLSKLETLYELPFPNLKGLYISQGPIHPSLPEAFATTLQGLEDLMINCTWTCIPEQVQQLTSLKRLRLYECGDELKQRCRKDEGEDWRIISHIPNIEINRKDVRSCDQFFVIPAVRSCDHLRIMYLLL